MKEVEKLKAQLLEKGLEQFNERQYFECHETLEDLWRQMALDGDKSSPLEQSEKQLVQGIIQVAVAYHHLLRGNVKGARRLFERAFPRLRQGEPSLLGLDVSALTRHVEGDYQKIGHLGDRLEPEAISVEVSSLEMSVCQIVAVGPLK